MIADIIVGIMVGIIHTVVGMIIIVGMMVGVMGIIVGIIDIL